NCLRSNHAKNRRQRSHHCHRKRRYLYRPFGRRWSRRFVEDNQSAGRRSHSSSDRAGQDDKDDLQRFRSELGLDGYELHAGNLHHRQRSVREVCRRVSAENGEAGKDGECGEEIIFWWWVMFVWRKRASAVWLAANEAPLRELGGQRLAIISRADRKSAIAGIAGSSRRNLEKIRSRFGGTIEKLPRDWLKRFSRSQKSEPIKIGHRLTIYRSVMSKNRSRNKNRSLLIPAGTAFGTGEHATTAMSLRLLERCTRFWGAQAASRTLFKRSSSASCRRVQAG